MACAANFAASWNGGLVTMARLWFGMRSVVRKSTPRAISLVATR
jgi:hypothetical protein